MFVIVGLIVSMLAVYGRTFWYGLVSDDMPAYRRTLEIKEKKPDKKMPFWEGLYWDMRGVYDLKRSHAISIAFHIATSVAVYVAFKNPWAAFLFAFNPITLMVSTWVSGRAYGMVTLFALVSWAIPSQALLLYAAAVYWSISALFYPLVFGFLGWHWSWLALLIIPATFWRFDAKKDHVSFEPGSKLMNESNKELRTLRPRKLIIWIKTYGYYFMETLFCYRMGLFHKFLYTFGLNKEENAKWYRLIDKKTLVLKKFKQTIWYPNPDLILGLLALVITGYGIAKGSYFQSLGFIWFFVNVAMWGNLITFNQQIAERYLYLPAVGLMLALASTLSPWGLSLFMVYYLTRLWWFMPSFMNEYWSVEYNLAEAKDLYYIWVSRGVHRYAEGNFHDALRNMLQAFSIRPEDFKTNINLMYLAVVLNDLALAKKHLDLASKCIVDGKEEEMANFVKRGTDLIAKIDGDIARDGKCQVNLAEIQLLL